MDEPHPLTALERLIAARMSRRDAMRTLGALAAALPALAQPQGAPPARISSLGFSELEHGLDATHHVPKGYSAQVLLRWGDAVMPGAPEFVPARADADGHERQFGYDNDFIAFLPLPRDSGSSTHGLLCVNHERCTQQLMWPGYEHAQAQWHMTRERCDYELASQGHSIVEVARRDGRWQVLPEGRHNRRVTGRSTRIALGGPAAGHARVRTAADPSGREVIGTINNCAGGVTPWGTILTCEENIHNYFLGDVSKGREAAAWKRYRIDGKPRYQWGRHFERFDLDKAPNEPNRFGWVVEIDAYDPTSTPVKRTALGRFKHEGATCALAADGRVAVYMGDDERFEYLYKFVTARRFVPGDAAANRDLLDSGTLYVARFEDDGRMRWLPLTHGQGPLTAANGFADQGDVVIEARRAADLLGATSMDRPEDVEAHPMTGRVYVVLTNNAQRKERNAANPRAPNPHGHIVELVPPRVDDRSDHGAESCEWEFFLLAGDPREAKHSARYEGPVSASGWLSCPDNVAFDPRGRMWIATDGQDETIQCADSLYAVDTIGAGRGSTRLFFNAPRGAEVCGPCFTPDGKTLFLAVQHPGDEKGSSYEKPSTRWPDFRDGVPPRPAVLAITREDGADIGN